MKASPKVLGGLRRLTLSIAMLMLGGGMASAVECSYTDGTWSPNSPTSADSVKLVSGNLTWKSPLPMTVAGWSQPNTYTGTVTFDTGLDTFTITGDVDLQGGTWTHTANPTPSTSSEAWISGRGTKQLIVACGGDFTLGATASINLVGRGFAKGKGPGYTSGCGGAHGGSGCGANGLCYGSPIAPITIGSGGRDSPGGGAVRLTVSSTLTVDGVINADGDIPSSGDDYGAGGSVYLTAGNFAGTGSIHANGGVKNTSVGGGGRIAFKRAQPGEISFGGTVTAYHARSNNRAAPGTIYYEKSTESAGTGKLVICGGGTATDMRTEFSDPDETYDFSELVLTNGASIAVRTGVLVKAAKFVVQSASMSRIKIAGGELRLPAGHVYTNVSIAATSAGGALASGPDGDLWLGKNASVNADGNLLVAGDLVLTNGATITHSSTTTTDNGYAAKVTVGGDMTIDAASTVNANALGFHGVAAGPGGSTTTAASHGGLAANAPTTCAYGSVKFPATLGSDDAASSAHGGGGRIRLVVGGKLTVDGKVSANGASRDSPCGTSGGSVWIDAGALAGAGSITAIGGAVRNGDTRGGGGGRVAVHLTKSGETFGAFETAGGVIGAFGGAAGKSFGDSGYVPVGPAGTVYLETVMNDVTNGTLVIDNWNASAPYGATGIGPNVTDAEVDHVVFRRRGNLRITQDGALTVHGDWTRDAAGGDGFAADAGDADHTAGAVAFADATRVSTVTGTNEFARLSIAAPGKTMRFGTETLAKTKAREFIVTGTEGELVQLRSTTDGTSWLLEVLDSASVEYADVMDSDARTQDGIKIAAKDSTDSGNNQNWSFSSIVVGETITWMGEASSGWENADNWDRGRAPVETDVVVIPGGKRYQPVFSKAVSLNSLSVGDGAELTLGGFDLTVTNVLGVAGELVCTGSEVITAAGPTVALTNFTCKTSTLLLAGELDQQVDLHGENYHVVRFEKSGGTVTMADGFSCYQFYVTPVAAFAVDFAAGKTVSATDCYVAGGSETPLLTFASASSGIWNLNVSRQGRIRGVALSNCTATGLALNDDLPGTNGGGNTNWRFGGTYCQWTGTAGNNFTNAANWADGKAPDETSLVYFDANASVTMTAPRTVRELQVAAGTVAFAKGTNVLTVAENLSIENGATLSLTTPCVVTNSVILRSGATLTHAAITSAPGANTNRLHLTVIGDMSVETGARVHADEKGFTCGCRGGLGAATGQEGASHGGISDSHAAYDSVFAPIHPGSTVNSGDWDNNAGGVIRLIVGGTLTLNGSISVNPTASRWWMATPGSVWITAGRLVGSGSISADVPEYTSNGGRAVSGGRIAVILTDGDFSAWSGTTTAYPVPSSGSVISAPGTVYLESAADGPKGGTLIIANRAGDVRAYGNNKTPIPVPGWDAAEDFSHVRVILNRRLPFSLTDDARVEDLTLLGTSSDGAKLFLNDHLLKVRSMAHRSGRGWFGTPERKDVYTTSRCDRGLSGAGLIDWTRGMMIFLR